MLVGRLLAGTPAMSLPVDQHRTRRDILEPGDRAQQRGLATARRPQQREELARRIVAVIPRSAW
jgi:hypothetical protein